MTLAFVYKSIAPDLLAFGLVSSRLRPRLAVWHAGLARGHFCHIFFFSAFLSECGCSMCFIFRTATACPDFRGRLCRRRIDVDSEGPVYVGDVAVFTSVPSARVPRIVLIVRSGGRGRNVSVVASGLLRAISRAASMPCHIRAASPTLHCVLHFPWCVALMLFRDLATVSSDSVCDRLRLPSL